MHDVTEVCPFDTRLARTPYFVLPKMAIQAMPMHWRKRLDNLLSEADAAGLDTPDYIVLRDDPAFTKQTSVDEDDVFSEFESADLIRRDPWADYRHASLADVQVLSPGFDPALARAPAESGWRPDGAKFGCGDRVYKPKGGQWQGRVCGFYSTDLTPIGYAVESEREIGSVQVWPEAALAPAPTRADEHSSK